MSLPEFLGLKKPQKGILYCLIVFRLLLHRNSLLHKLDFLIYFQNLIIYYPLATMVILSELIELKPHVMRYRTSMRTYFAKYDVRLFNLWGVV